MDLTLLIFSCEGLWLGPWVVYVVMVIGFMFLYQLFWLCFGWLMRLWCELWFTEWSELNNQIIIPGVKPAVLKTITMNNKITNQKLKLHSIQNMSLYKHGGFEGSLESPQKWKWRVIECLIQINLFALPKLSKNYIKK